jgi:predicted nucleic acid-binding protein
MARYLVDTNVLLRMLQPQSAQRAAAVQAIAGLAAKGDLLFVTPQVMIEFWAVSTRPLAVNGFAWSPKEAATQVSGILERFPLLEDSPAVFQHWTELVSSHGVTGKQAHDVRLVAVMQAHDVAMLLTFNTDDFSRYQSMTAIHPDSVQ